LPNLRQALRPEAFMITIQTYKGRDSIEYHDYIKTSGNHLIKILSVYYIQYFPKIALAQQKKKLVNYAFPLLCG